MSEGISFLQVFARFQFVSVKIEALNELHLKVVRVSCHIVTMSSYKHVRNGSQNT